MRNGSPLPVTRQTTPSHKPQIAHNQDAGPQSARYAREPGHCDLAPAATNVESARSALRRWVRSVRSPRLRVPRDATPHRVQDGHQAMPRVTWLACPESLKKTQTVATATL